MWYDVSRAETPGPVAALTLLTVYEVRADISYDVAHGGFHHGEFVAIRTVGGEGVLNPDQPAPFRLTANTLLIIPGSKIRRFLCPGKSWRFWWFEFHPAGGLPLPVQRLLEMPVARGEPAGMRACFADLRRNGPRFQARASARFALLLHDWAAHWPEPVTPRTRHEAAIQRVTQLMPSRIGGRVGLSEMARTSGLSERRFRQVFAETTGKSPKRFHEELRLRKAADHLRFRAGNISETAYVFDYSSPFHFSKAFRGFFGVPPSLYLKEV